MDIIEKIAKNVASEPTVVYSAIIIDVSDRKRITENAVHPNLYGEHATLHYFGSDGGTETPYAGERVTLRLMSHFSDDRGEAWLAECGNRHVLEIKEPSQVMHVTVSCADGTRPVYSNELFGKVKADDAEGFSVHGRIAYYMSDRSWRVE